MAQFLPQNTLVGLPNELIGNIMSFAMSKPTPIDTRHQSSGRPSKLASDIATTLYPFTRLTGGPNDVLLPIARAEYYEQNTMLAYIAVHRNTRRILDDDPAHRQHIRHLIIEIPMPDQALKYDGAGAWGTLSALADVAVLKRVPELYPQLRSLTVRITNRLWDNGYYADHSHVDLETLALWERWKRNVVAYNLAFLTVVVDAMRHLPSSPRLKAKSIDFKHQSNWRPQSGISTELTSGDVEEAAAASLAWQILDLPEAIVRFPVNSRVDAPASHSVSCDGDVVGELSAPYQVTFTRVW